MLRKTLTLALLLLIAAASAPEDLLREAQQLEKDGSHQKAIPIYKQFLSTYADHTQAVEARYRLAKCFDVIGSVDEAIAELKTVSAADARTFRNKPDAFYLLGKLQAGKKDYPSAIKTFEKMLAENPGIYEDEVLMLLGGYYALSEKYDDAAAKYNLLIRKGGDAKQTENAHMRICLLWLKAKKLDQAVQSLSEFAQAFPNNKEIPEMMLKAADNFREARKFDKTISLCEQLKQRYPKSVEAQAGGYLLGLCWRDQGEFQKAADALDTVGNAREAALRPLASEALVQAAEIYFAKLPNMEKAMPRYDEAAKIAREAEWERRPEVLEHCYFRLAEWYYTQKKYAVALEYYTKLREVGSKVNIFGRIIDCQDKLGLSENAGAMTPVDIRELEKRIAEKPNTPEAFEAQVMILNWKFRENLTRRQPIYGLAPEYEKLLSYPRDILNAANEHRVPYIHIQVATCLANGTTADDVTRAIQSYQKALAAEKPEENIYRITILESMAQLYNRLGQTDKASQIYKQLFEAKKAELDKNKDDKALEKRTLEYLKGMASNAAGASMIDDSIALAKKIIEEKGSLSDLSREARFYLGELYYLKKEWSTAAKTYQEFIQIYGPKQDARGDLAEAPWRPQIDEKVQQIYDAAVRVAHAWYMQRHDQNMVAAYQWIVKNIPNGNRYLPEAQYWLAMEYAKGSKAQTPEQKRKFAEAMFKGVVGSSLDFDDPKFRSTLWAWVGSGEERWIDTQQYVRPAIMRCGQAFADLNDHPAATGCFRLFLDIYGGGVRKLSKNAPPPERDEMAETARYALGREYIAVKNWPKLAETYRPYVTGGREDRFRISALSQLGYYASQNGMSEVAVEAYATILDEYGENNKDAQGKPIPVPPKDRIRPETKAGWNGIRLPAPPSLDLGEMRFALGLHYWRTEDFGRCLKTLEPFLSDVRLKKNASRPKALYMAGQSAYKFRDYATGAKLIGTVCREYPKYEAIEEAYVNAARGYMETKNWTELEILHGTFAREWKKSDWLPRMELYAALCQIGKNNVDKGMAALRAIANSDTYQDVRADAWYNIAANLPGTDPTKVYDAAQKSVSILPRERACLLAGKTAIKLRKWEQARDMLERVVREFPKGDPDIINEAKKLLPEVQVELAKTKK